MSPLPAEHSQSTDEPEVSSASSTFTAPTADMKRRNIITGLLFFALVLVLISISIWRRFYS